MTIEENFPIEEIQLIAKIESQRRQFYRPIYSVHKSWARRTGSTFRAIGLSNFYSGPLFENLEIGEGVFYTNHNYSNKIVLDPFCGGGTTIVEFIRLGIKAIGIDVNPVSWFTTKKQIDKFDEALFNNEVLSLYKRAGKRIKSFYKTNCPKCNSSKADIMYTFWVRKIKCPECASDEDLFKYYIIGKKKREHPETMVICPKCHFLFYSKGNLSKHVSCMKCNNNFIPKLGNCRLKYFTCTKCSSRKRLVDLLNNPQNSLSARQIAIEFFCPTCGIRDYKPITERDLEKYEEITDIFEKRKSTLIYPRGSLPEIGKNINNLRNYGFTHFSDLFNPRQLLSLSLILEEIIKISDQNVKEYFLAAFSSSLEFHTVICPYNYTMKQIVNIFNFQSFLVPTMFVENNVWGTKKGNGTFLTYLERIRKAKNFCINPFEIAPSNGKITRIPIKGDQVETILEKDFNSLVVNDKNSTLLISDTSEDLEKLGIPKESVDIIATDPPYFDFISYTELANFFYVWLKIGLEERYEHFRPDLIETSNEIGSQKKEKSFVTRITKVFQECYKVLKPNCPLVFTFHHSESTAWGMIIQALVKSNFIITASYPIHSEFKARPAGGRNFDIIIVCRKRCDKTTTLTYTSLSELKDEITDVIDTKSNKENNYKNIAIWEDILASILPKITEFIFQNLSIEIKYIIKEIFAMLDKVKITME
ncbi:MAG: DNA methyltransferase [Candidatus Hodarchaeales archaeon]